ncbi:MAG: restriction endonuclease subunit S [Candidatus Cloacimonadaceae bacterium]|jgi:type I restriction enzyme S subunit|nr:restriction endonuclease subunit S [Candidatus Cloacimonadaceae bacterium]
MAIKLTEKQIKDGWQVVKFGEIAKNISKRVEPSETDLEVYVGLEHLDPQSLRITRRGVPADVKGQKLRVRPGQIIFGKRRAYQKKVAVADFEGICSAHAMVLEEVVGKIIPGLLPFFMQSDMFMDRAVAISEGSLSPTIKWKTLAIQEFPLPPIERQKEILEVLEKVEVVEKKYTASENSVNNLLFTCLNDVFSKNPSKYNQVSQIADVLTGQNSAIDKSLSAGVKMVTLPCVNQYCEFSISSENIAFIDPVKVKDSDYLKGDDILFNWRNGSQDHIGKTALIQKDLDYVHVGFFLRIKTDKSKVSPHYLYWYLRYLKHSGFFSGAKQQVNRTFNKGELLLLDIARYSPEEEDRIASMLNSISAEKKAVAKSVKNYKSFRRSLATQILQGGVQ